MVNFNVGKITLGEIIKRLKSASKNLKEAFGEAYVGLLLFGSYARGEASDRSDVDVLVVMRGLKGLKVRGDVYGILAKHVGRPLTLIDVDLADISRDDLEVTPLLLNALYDGVIVYDGFGVLERLKLKTIELIRKANLVRYRTPDGKYGWKRANGKPIEAVEA
ncbi:nucleotidyltransferase domain-containing protein [Candidatus Bathyarchaeota archaeon]|nr:MAG: nucleotidyltransferase domain-containing protein [Candidatus Bathyarchaeota archaeon]